MKERELEDWVCRHLRDFFYQTNGVHWEHCNAKMIARQLTIPVGRIDILAFFLASPVVIELKVKPLTEADVGQVLRYRGCLERLVEQAAFDMDLVGRANRWIGPRRAIYQGYAIEATDLLSTGDMPVANAVLVGPSIDNKVLTAATVAGVDVAIYTHNPTDKTFSFDRKGGPTFVDEIPPEIFTIVSLIDHCCTESTEYDYHQDLYKMFGMEIPQEELAE